MGKRFIFLALLVSLPFLAFSAEIVLKNGKVLMGRIIEENPEFIKVEISGIAIKYNRQDIETIDGKKPDFSSAAAGDDFKKGRVLSEDWVKHYSLAEKYVDERQFEQAISEFTEVLKIDPQAFEAYTGIGFVYIELGKYEQALENFNKAIEINPDYAQAYDNIGVVYWLQRQYQQAIPYFEKAIYVNPDYLPAITNLGSIYILLNRYPEAVIYYLKAFQIDPTNADSAYNLGVAYQGLGKNPEAKDYLLKAIELYKAGGDDSGVQKAETQLKAIP